MEGRGVTNYASGKPSHALTTKTTEFDDALVNRGIVSVRQVMLAKGASSDEAVRLEQEKQQNSEPLSNSIEDISRPDSFDSDDSFDNDFNDDDEFFTRYRKERLAQIQNSNSAGTTDFVEHISRDDWSAKVNKASNHRWVLVTLLDSSTRKQEILQELVVLKREYSAHLSLLTIDATDAIPNWPEKRVPAMFAYRDGIKQKEWITNQQGQFPTQQHLQRMLEAWGVLERL